MVGFLYYYRLALLLMSGLHYTTLYDSVTSSWFSLLQTAFSSTYLTVFTITINLFFLLSLPFSFLYYYCIVVSINTYWLSL